MLRYENFFDSLVFFEAVLGRPNLEGDRLIVPVWELPVLRDHPAWTPGHDRIDGRLVFEGVTSSERELAEYVGDPRSGEGFREPRREVDGPFPEELAAAPTSEFYLEGVWKSPPAWIGRWLIRAREFALEVPEESDRGDNR